MSPISAAAQIIIRLAVLAGLGVAGFLAAGLIYPDGDAGAAIGVGLLYFGAVSLIAFGWALIDARRAELLPVIVVWGIVGALLGLGTPLLIAIGDGDLDWSVVVSDLVFFVPFMLSLVVVPAALGAVVGGLTRKSGAS